MNYTVIFAEMASSQLEAIRDYIAVATDPRTAAQYVDTIIDHCLDLATFPHRGVRRDDLRPRMRVMSYRKRVNIAFAVDDGTLNVTILGIFYGGQDLDGAFASDRPSTSASLRPRRDL